MRHLPGLAFLLLAVLPFALRFASPSADGPEPALADGEEEVLIIVSPHRRELREEYDRAFPAYMARVHNRRVRIAWRDPGGGTGAILNDIDARYKQGAGPGVDLFFGGGVDPHMASQRKGYLQPIPPTDDIRQAIPATVAGQPVYDPEGHWYGVALASFGVIYDEKAVARLGQAPPREWADLGHPAYAGWLASGDPQRSGVVYTCYETILQAYGFEAGWRLLARMAGNTRIFGDGAAVAPTEVAAGDAAAGMAIENYAATVIRNAENPDLAFVLPEGLTLVNADAISCFRGGPNLELARLFIHYCLSPEGQRLLIQPAGVDGQRHTQRRFPVRRELYDGPYAPSVNPYASRGGFVYNNRLAQSRRGAVSDLASTWFIDTHGYLVAAWRAVIARGSRPEEVDALTRPPLSEAELAELAKSWTADRDDRVRQDEIARERVRQRRAWSIAARERYKALTAIDS